MTAPEQLPPPVLGAARPFTRSSNTVLVLEGAVSRAQIPGLCSRARGLMDGEKHVLVCDVRDIQTPDAVVVDALARLQLTAQRLGCEIRVANASTELKDLIALMGLTGTLLLYD
ncbi:MAG: hypothetical protein QOH26_741 [Actinomycetota bacterium]|nr:hypothetical protein [Actinomycetota bacterium]